MKKRQKKKFPISFKHNSHKITIDTNGRVYSIKIDNEVIPFLKVGRSKYIANYHAPYLMHKTLKGLALHVSDSILIGNN